MRLERENGEDIRRSRSKLPTKFKIGYKITSIPVGIAAASSAILMNPITLAITNSLSAGYELVRNSSEQVKSYLPYSSRPYSPRAFILQVA
ncbi:hypothetical protein J4404_02815 [Candidatus Woesearchaeota archaeon]|nr:hypothetical protein [Candidatus Woesearchaeota archaeon]